MSSGKTKGVNLQRNNTEVISDSNLDTMDRICEILALASLQMPVIGDDARQDYKV